MTTCIVFYNEHPMHGRLHEWPPAVFYARPRSIPCLTKTIQSFAVPSFNLLGILFIGSNLIYGRHQRFTGGFDFCLSGKAPQR